MVLDKSQKKEYVYYNLRMKKLVIANRGASEIGKSAAVKCVYNLLKKKGFETIKEIWQYKEDADIKAVFIINGVKVGVESQGDPGCDMEKTMEEFVNDGCEIIITACRTRSDTYRKVKDYLGTEKQFDIIWYAHYVYQAMGQDSTRQKLNRKYAQQVVELIEKRIAGDI